MIDEVLLEVDKTINLRMSLDFHSPGKEAWIMMGWDDGMVIILIHLSNLGVEIDIGVSMWFFYSLLFSSLKVASLDEGEGWQQSCSKEHYCY